MPTARLRGLTRYTFLDENDQPTFALDQHGRAIWGGFWSPNLITNAGLDAVAVERLITYMGSLASQPQQFREFLRVGVGSTAPAFTDTSLVSEVASSESGGGFSGSTTFPDPSGGTIEMHALITRVATMPTTENLTEYGFSRLVDTNLNIRELFRDEFGDPVTISIVAGKKIRVDHTLIVSLPWGAEAHTLSIEEYDASDALVTTHSLSVNGVFVAVFASNRVRMFKSALPPQGASGDLKRFALYTTATPSSEPDVAASNAHEASITDEDYVPGSHTLTQFATYNEAVGNGPAYGYVLRQVTLTGQGDGGEYGYRVAFQSPTTFEKEDTHTLRLAVDLSWARG